MTIRKTRLLVVPLALVFVVSASLMLPGAVAKKQPKCFGRAATKVGTRKAELLIGTAKADVIVGRGGADQIDGKGGNDLICGSGGGDIVFGSTGDDRIDGGRGDDTLFGMEGDDQIKMGDGFFNGAVGGAGNDRLIGGNGFDLIAFVDAPNPVNVDLAAGTATGDGADTLSEIDGVAGSGSNDTIRGTAGTNILLGGGGNDTIFTGGNTGDFATPATQAIDVVSGDGDPQAPPGNDTLNGGDGMNVLDYSLSEAAVQVDLTLGTANGEGLDTVTGFNVVIGSEFDDTLTGNGEDNAFQPFLGNDSIDGSGGTDTLILLSATGGATASLATGSSTGDGTDTFSAIENLWGSGGPDKLTGDDARNAIYGLEGADQIGAGAGDDRLDGGDGIDALDGGDGNDSCTTGETVANCELTTASANRLIEFQSIANLRKRSAFRTTLMEDPAIAAAAIIGSSRPKAAAGIATML